MLLEVDHYFAYGSNMNPLRVAERGLKSAKPMSALLRFYRLVFNKRSKGSRTTGHANIEYDPVSNVEGVLYKLDSSEEILKMDPFENAPVNYSREAVRLETECGVRWAWTYFANPALKQDGLLPEREYLDHLLKGKSYLSISYYNNLERHEVSQV